MPQNNATRKCPKNKERDAPLILSACGNYAFFIALASALALS